MLELLAEQLPAKYVPDDRQRDDQQHGQDRAPAKRPAFQRSGYQSLKVSGAPTARRSSPSPESRLAPGDFRSVSRDNVTIIA
jgi:hypothetical protein